jgi:hypothetical protein
MSIPQQSITRVTQVWPVWLPKVARTESRFITREAAVRVGVDIFAPVPGVPLKTLPAKQIFEKHPKSVYTTLYANSHYPAPGL